MKYQEELEKFDDDISGRIIDLAAKVEDNIGIGKEEVYEDFINEYQMLKSELPDRDDEMLQHQTWIRREGRWNAELNSDEPMMEGIIIGAGDAWDPQADRKEKARKMMENDKFEEAVEKGLIDNNGNFLNERGNEIPDNTYTRKLRGYYRKMDSEEEPKKFIMNLNGWRATDIDYPIMKPVRWRAEVADFDGGEDDWDYLNAGRSLRFNEIESDVFDPEIVIEDADYLKDQFTELHKIDEIHDSRLGYTELHATTGFTGYINRNPNNKTGNMRMNISNEKMGDHNITVWIPEHLHHKVEGVDTGSKFWVYGYIREDEYEGETTYSIQAWGLHAIEDWRIDMVQEQNVDTSDDFSTVYE